MSELRLPSVLNVRVTPSGVFNVRVTPSGMISRFEDRFNSPGNTRRERFSRLKPQLWAFLAAKAATLNGIHF